ncbi:MAG: hypothetical protein KDK53_24260 [Maritimibacter sp.]|nr:hypothetical protein [Maritimibacter sp.]
MLRTTLAIIAITILPTTASAEKILLDTGNGSSMGSNQSWFPGPNFDEMTQEEFGAFLDRYLLEKKKHPFAVYWPLDLYEPTQTEARSRAAAQKGSPPAMDPSPMSFASQTALKYLDKVLSISMQRNGRLSGALMLGIVPTDGTRSEPEYWVTDIKENVTGFSFSGTILGRDKVFHSRFNLPSEPNAGFFGFNYDDIRDWGIVGAEQRVFGRFTTRVMIELMPDKLPESKEADVWREALSEDPLPSGW